MQLLSAIIAARMAGQGRGSGSGGGKYVHVAGTTPSIAAAKDTIYLCDDTITALTISSLPDEGFFEIIFTAGATAPQITAPAYVVYAEDSDVTAGKVNELSYNVFSLGSARYAQGVIGVFDEPGGV